MNFIPLLTFATIFASMADFRTLAPPGMYVNVRVSLVADISQNPRSRRIGNVKVTHIHEYCTTRTSMEISVQAADVVVP